MLKKDDHFELGSLLKTTGIKGEIIARFNNEIPKKLNKLESVFVEIDGKLVPFFIENIQIKSNYTASIKFEGVIDEQKAKEYIGCTFYLPSEYKSIIGISDEDNIEVIGYTVKDQSYKTVGTVLEYFENTENPLLLVKTLQHEILIPAHDDLIIEVDDDEKQIILEIADGIMDLEE